MRSTLTVETQLLSNEKFGNRSSENVPLNLNLLVSIFLSLLVSFSFQYLVFGFYFYSFTVTLERNSVCCILFHFPYSVFDFALLSLYPYLLIRYKFVLRHFTKKRQTKINTTSISNVFVPCASHFLKRSFYNREPPRAQEWEHHKNHKIRLATLPVYHACQ